MRTFLQSSFLVFMIVVIQFASFGLLINKHYCKGRLTETSVFLANKGCAKDVSVFDRIFHSISDCHSHPQKEGLNKTPCCDFNSSFDKISVYHESLADYQIIGVITSGLIKDSQAKFEIPQKNSSVHFVDRGPPDKGVSILIWVCRLLI